MNVIKQLLNLKKMNIWIIFKLIQLLKIKKKKMIYIIMLKLTINHIFMKYLVLLKIILMEVLLF